LIDLRNIMLYGIKGFPNGQLGDQLKLYELKWTELGRIESKHKKIYPKPHWDNQWGFYFKKWG
jgi:hypothetical protein